MTRHVYRRPLNHPTALHQRLLRARHGNGVGELLVLMLAAVMIAASAVIHLYLWGEDDGYRAVPTIGPLFLAQGASGCLLAVAIVAARRFVVTAAGCVYMALSVGGLYISMHGGLFGYPETLDAPWVKTTLLVEVIGLVAGIGACWSALPPKQKRSMQ